MICDRKTWDLPGGTPRTLYDAGRAGERLDHYLAEIPFQPNQIRAERLDLDQEERKEMLHFLHIVLFNKIVNKFGGSWRSSHPFLSWSQGTSESGKGWFQGLPCCTTLDVSGNYFRGESNLCFCIWVLRWPLCGEFLAREISAPVTHPCFRDAGDRCPLVPELLWLPPTLQILVERGRLSH